MFIYEKTSAVCDNLKMANLEMTSGHHSGAITVQVILNISRKLCIVTKKILFTDTTATTSAYFPKISL